MSACSHTLFVTSTQYQGGFNAAQAADATCAAHGATIPNSWGNWKAVINGPQPASQRIRQIGIVRNSAGSLLFTVGAIFGGSLFNSPAFDENGAATSVVTWTGTTASGGMGPSHCNGFTTNMDGFTGVMGNPQFTDGRCSTNRRANAVNSALSIASTAND